jgi:hypothetical protein
MMALSARSQEGITKTSISALNTSSCRKGTGPSGLRHGLVLIVVGFAALFLGTDRRILFEWSKSSSKDFQAQSVRAAGVLGSSMINYTERTECSTLKQHDADLAVTRSPTPMDGEMWCVLDKKNTRIFNHFPPASETLLPCWSWFQRIGERTGESNMSCGFYFDTEP